MALLFWRQIWKIHPYVRIRRGEDGTGIDDAVAGAPKLVAGRGWARRKPERSKLLFHGAIVLGAVTLVCSLILLYTVSVVAGAAVLAAIMLSCLLLIVRKVTEHGPLKGPALRRSGRPVGGRSMGGKEPSREE